MRLGEDKKKTKENDNFVISLLKIVCLSFNVLGYVLLGLTFHG